MDDEEHYDRVDPNELEDLFRETDDDSTDNNQENEPPEAEARPAARIHDGVSVTDSEGGSVQSLRRSGRVTREPKRLTYAATQRQKTIKFEKGNGDKHMEECYNIDSGEGTKIYSEAKYDRTTAMLAAKIMTDVYDQVKVNGASFAQQYVIQKGLKKFGKRGEDAVNKELDQLHRRNCFVPVDVSTMNAKEKKRAQAALMLLTEKRDGSVKGRCVYNGKPTREWLSKDDAASPTVATESLMITATIDATEERDVMTAVVPNAFILTKMPELEKGADRILMKITGVLVDLLVKIAPEVYGPFVVMENGKKVLYVQILMVLYGMLMAALLWYKQFRTDLEEIGFVFNPYEPCVANRLVMSKQHTVRFHVDDLKSSHVDRKVNDEFHHWLNHKYGKYGEVKVTRGKVHEYLGMTFDYSKKGTIQVGMVEYVENMLKDFPRKLGANEVSPTPATDKLFNVDEDSPKLDKTRAEEFHTTVAKGLFACKRARPDIQPTIAFLCTRVKSPTEQDWDKLIKLMKYLNGTKDDKLLLTADDLRIMKWYVDASFAVHPDFKSHTGAVSTMGDGAIQSISRKQKINTKSSTEAELVAVDDISTMILWTQLFMESQGYDLAQNIVYQDNKSAILLETNGKKSSSKRTRALNIRYFFITDQVERKKVEIQYCPTGEMTADYMTKPLQGKLFEKFRDEIMGVKVKKKKTWADVVKGTSSVPLNNRNGRSVLKKSFSTVEGQTGRELRSVLQPLTAKNKPLKPVQSAVPASSLFSNNYQYNKQ